MCVSREVKVRLTRETEDTPVLTFVVVFTIVCCGDEERTSHHMHKTSAFLFVMMISFYGNVQKQQYLLTDFIPGFNRGLRTPTL